MLTLRDSWEWEIAASAFIAARTKPCASIKSRPLTPGALLATPEVHADLLPRLA